jgi:hypothetical protein
MDRLAIYDGTPLREVEHQIPIPPLDQEDLLAQGIDTSRLAPGAQKMDALGSCTCNAGASHLAERLQAAGFPLSHAYLQPGDQGVMLTDDAVQAEEFAIVLYHLVTDQTGDPSQEWPPTDCGSSGYYVCTELERQGLARSYKSGSGVHGALSLLQKGSVMQGSPWLNSFFTPDSQGFIDGDGSYGAFRAAVESGIAGGHETLQYAIPQLAQASSGVIDLHRTVIKVRNSWSSAWGNEGSYLVHASTLNYLAQHVDYKQIVVA